MKTKTINVSAEWRTEGRQPWRFRYNDEPLKVTSTGRIRHRWFNWIKSCKRHNKSFKGWIEWPTLTILHVLRTFSKLRAVLLIWWPGYRHVTNYSTHTSTSIAPASSSSPPHSHRQFCVSATLGNNHHWTVYYLLATCSVAFGFLLGIGSKTRKFIGGKSILGRLT